MPDSLHGQSGSTLICAANACRAVATERLTNGNGVVIVVCAKHARTYRGLGYRPEGSTAA